MLVDLPSEGLAELKERIATERGLDLSSYKDPYLLRRVAARLTATNCEGIPEYLDHLISDPGEWNHLMDRLTVNVTEFFRNPSTFEILRDEVIPEIIAEKVGAHRSLLRVWSAGCSDGKEAYSMAIILQEALEDYTGTLRYSVTGTDIDHESLKRAKKGFFEPHKLEDLEGQVPERYRHYFELRDNGWQVDRSLRERCRFFYLDLLKPLEVKNFDIILCRNVMIYFDRDSQNNLITGFQQALNRGGILVLGRTEALKAATKSLYEVFSGPERIFRRRDS